MPIHQHNLLIRNGHLIDPANHLDAPLDVLLEAGKVSRVGKNLSADADTPILEAAGLVRAVDARAVEVVAQQHHVVDAVLRRVDAHLQAVRLLLFVVAAAAHAVRLRRQLLF